VENNQVTPNVDRPDPEVQAGRALRRLRMSRGWSQEEVAKRMQAYGYDFHQTMIAKIEAAQRPLRVRELADFAALYNVEVNELIYPSSDSLEEVTRELIEAEMLRAVRQREAEAAAERAQQARADLDDAEEQLYTAEKQLATLHERVQFLRQEQVKLSPRPDPSHASTPAEFLDTLRQFRDWAGTPGYRQMDIRAGGVIGPKAMALALGSPTELPTLQIMRAVIRGCGGNEHDLAAFTAAWRRIHSTRK
jgi:transcriptional regulator with XRE-family HTH domain